MGKQDRKKLAAKKTVQKKPAAKPSLPRKTPVRTAAGTLTNKNPFNLSEFCQDVMAQANVSLVPCRKLKLITGCSGSGGPTLVLRAILGDNAVDEEMSCEKDEAASYALFRNVRPKHVFNYMSQCLRDKAPCKVHQQQCKVPLQPDLFVVGFTCKANSRQNPRRFSQDPTSSHHYAVFEETCSLILHQQPRYFVLENVDGVRCKRGGESEQAFTPVLETIMTRLSQMTDYTCEHISVSSIVLPTPRDRVFFIGSREDGAGVIVEEIRSLVNVANSMPKHHLEAFLGDGSSVSAAAGDPASIPTSGTLADEAQYAKHLSAAFAKATSRKRIDDAPLAPPPERESAKYASHCSPWLRAQLDVYEAIVNKLRLERPHPNNHGIADTSQNTDRGGARVDGCIPTVCTSTSLYSFKRHAFLSPEEVHSMHGFHGYNFQGLSKMQAFNLIGNGMVSTSVALVLLPVLRHLGFTK